MGCLGSSAWDFIRLESKYWWDCHLIWSLGAFFKLIQVVSIIQFAVVFGLRSLFSCWQSAGGVVTQLLKGTLILAMQSIWRYNPSIYKASNDMSNPSHALKCWFSLPQDFRPRFKRLIWLGQAHKDNVPFEYLKINWLVTLITSAWYPFAMWCNIILGLISHHIHVEFCSCCSCIF